METMTRAQALKITKGILNDCRLKGFFQDEDWAPINRVFRALQAAGLEYDCDSRYTDIRGQLNGKTWYFHIVFISPAGRLYNIEMRLLACGAGTVEYPLARYDIISTVY